MVSLKEILQVDLQHSTLRHVATIMYRHHWSLPLQTALKAVVVRIVLLCVLLTYNYHNGKTLIQEAHSFLDITLGLMI